VEGVLEIEPEFAAGLRDLDGFSRVIVLWHMHLMTGHALTVVPFLDDATPGSPTASIAQIPRAPTPASSSPVSSSLACRGTAAIVEIEWLPLDELGVTDGSLADNCALTQQRG
jgi:hypothetical protein